MVVPLTVLGRAQPAQGVVEVVDHGAVCVRWTFDHDDGDVQAAGGNELGVVAPGVLGDDGVDGVAFEQGDLVGDGEWPPGPDAGEARELLLVDGLDGPDNEVDLIEWAEGTQSRPTDREQHPSGTERHHRSCSRNYVCHLRPAITDLGSPLRTLEPHERGSGSTHSTCDVCRHARSKRVRCVHDRVEALLHEVRLQPVDAPEPTHPQGAAVVRGSRGAPGERDNDVHVIEGVEGVRQRPGLGRAGEEEHLHGWSSGRRSR